MVRLGVLISGSGTNLQALIDSIEDGGLEASIKIVIADRPAAGLKRASLAGIPTLLLDRSLYGDSLSGRLMKELVFKVDLIILAGFLSVLDRNFVRHWKRRIINIHPSLLPAYGGKGMYGSAVHKAVIKAGERYSGCSVHFVEEGIDTGEIIKQTEVPVMEGDTPESLGSRVLKEEHRLIVSAVKEIAERMEVRV